ncbi:hypothetical protein HAX54_047937, partial [Datura stramonium]|nr:hypothetical protein [Datura stramonium]
MHQDDSWYGSRKGLMGHGIEPLFDVELPNLDCMGYGMTLCGKPQIVAVVGFVGTQQRAKAVVETRGYNGS